MVSCLDYFPVYAGQLLTDPTFSVLTMPQQGVALRLWCLSWVHGALPADLSTLLRLLPRDADEADVTTVLDALWTRANDGFRSARLEEEREAATAAYSGRARGAKAANRTRKAKQKAQLAPSPTPDAQCHAEHTLGERSATTHTDGGKDGGKEGRKGGAGGDWTDHLTDDARLALDGFATAHPRPAMYRAAVRKYGPGGTLERCSWATLSRALETLGSSDLTGTPGEPLLIRHIDAAKRQPERHHTTVTDDLGRTRPAYREGNVWHFTDAEGGTLEVPGA